MFPHEYLAKEVSPRTAAKKKREGLCKHFGCSRLARSNARVCETCNSRKQRIRDWRGYIYRQVCDSAAKRGIDCSLTLEEFLDFDARTGYCAKRGQAAGCLSIDRIDPDQGYHADNIRAIDWELNSARKIDGMTRPAEAIADALARVTGKPANHFYALAESTLVLVELLQVEVDGGWSQENFEEKEFF